MNSIPDTAAARVSIDNGERPRKRQRVSRACDNCRNRKTACDGRRPICMACQSREAADTCTYAFVPKRESESISHRRHAEDSPKPASPSGTALKVAQAVPAAVDDTPLDEAFSSAPSDGLATLAGRGDASAYGPSSTVAFLRNIIARGSRLGSPILNSNATKSSTHATPPRPRTVETISDSSQITLPLRRNADDFLLCYWEFIHPVFPLIHLTSFVRQYERLWASRTATQIEGEEMEEDLFMAILNLVFALGCKLSNLVPSAQRGTMADDFYQKSRSLSEYSILDSPSVATVQLLALSGVYLQSTEYASRCWNTVGLAVRAAQSLGMHVEVEERRLNQVEREMRRRIWHTCISLDRLVSMTFGRPAMIDQTDNVPLPAMIDDEYLSTTKDGRQPWDKPSRFGAFVHSCKLFELLGQVLSFLSSPALQHTTTHNTLFQSSNVLSQVLDLNRRLDKFSEEVPPYLRRIETTSPYTPSNDNHVNLQQRVLHCRLMLVRLLLLRPLLLMATRMEQSATIKALDGTVQSSLDAELIKSCCNLCLRTAHRLIDAVYYNLNTLYRSSGWHAVYFTFSAAIVLLASLKCPLVDITTDDEKFEASWTRCMAVFEHYRDQIQSAVHAILVLRAMRSQLSPAEVGSDHDRLDHHTTSAVTSAGNEVQEQVRSDLSIDTFDPFGFDSIYDAWFGQQLVNLDWLELPEP